MGFLHHESGEEAVTRASVAAPVLSQTAVGGEAADMLAAEAGHARRAQWALGGLVAAVLAAQVAAGNAAWAPGLVVLATASAWAGFASPRRRAIAALAALDDPAALPALLEAHARHAGACSAATERALVRAITRLAAAATPEQAAMSADMRQHIALALHGARSRPQLAMASALLNYARLGGVSGLNSEADRLATRRGKSAATAALRRAARAYLEANGVGPALADSAAAALGAVELAAQQARPAVDRDELARARELVKEFYRAPRQRRRQVEEALLSMGPAATEALLESLEAEARGWAVRRLWYSVAALAGIACMAVTFAWCFIRANSTAEIDATAFVLGAEAAGSLVMAAAAISQLSNKAARLLGRLDDRRAVPPLIDALSLEDAGTRRSAREGLLRLLPHLAPADAGLLSDGHHERLHQILTGSDRPLILAVLKAYEQVGQENDLPLVSALAAGNYEARASSDVQLAAISCVGYLQVRVEKERPGRMLLRASAADGSEVDLLVRPAATTVTDESTLLRPSEEEEE